jgi:methionine sulfoxide reductase heme-binding subunit
MNREVADHTPSSRPRRLLLLAATAAAVALVFFLLTPGQPIIQRLSKATAYAALLLLAAAIIVGPLRVLRGESNPLSTYFRRDIGIVAGILALAHTIIGLQVHFQGDFGQYFFYRTPAGLDGLRHDPFGVANDLGLLATAIILVLLVFSNNRSIRALGPVRWKRVQRLNYVGSILVIIHGLLYQIMEKRALAFVLCLVFVTVVAALLQISGFKRSREQRQQRD